MDKHCPDIRHPLGTVKAIHNHSSSELSDGKRDSLRPILPESESSKGARQALTNVILLLKILVCGLEFTPQAHNLPHGILVESTHD